MKFWKTVLLFGAALLMSATSLLAQEDVLRPHGRSAAEEKDNVNYLYRRSPWALGVEAGINYNMYSRDITWTNPANSNQFAGFKTMTGFSPYFSGFVDFSLSDNIGLELKLTYDIKYLTNTATFDTTLIYQSSPVSARETIGNKTTIDYFGISPLIRINLTPKLYLTAGPFIQFPMSTNQVLTYDAVYNSPFIVIPPTHESQSSDIKSALIDRVGLEVGVGYKIPLSNTIYLVPSAHFQFNLSDIENNFDLTDDFGNVVVRSSNSRIHSLQLGLALWFDL